MKNGFLTLFSHTVEDENGDYRTVKVEEFYECETFIESETKVNTVHEDIICCEGLFIETMQRQTFEDIIFSKSVTDETSWYKVSVRFVSGETVTGKPRYKTVHYLIQSEDNAESIEIVNDQAIMQLPDSEVVATVKTKVVGIHLEE